MKAKVKSLKVDLVGENVPGKFGGAAGCYIEDLLIEKGYQLSKKDTVDIPGLGLEVKSRDNNSTSAQTVGSMQADAIAKTPYKESPIYKKLQQQYRVKTEDQVIVSAEVYDFSSVTLQEKIEEAYETARAKIINGDRSDYISGGKFGFFELKKPGTTSYAFRLTNNAMKKLEFMSRSTFDKLFTFE